MLQLGKQTPRTGSGSSLLWMRSITCSRSTLAAVFISEQLHLTKKKKYQKNKTKKNKTPKAPEYEGITGSFVFSPVACICNMQMLPVPVGWTLSVDVGGGGFHKRPPVPAPHRAERIRAERSAGRVIGT